MLVFLNDRASYGRASTTWTRIEGALRERVGAFDVERVESQAGVSESMRQAAARGERVFVAAGGDGTVNLLVNAIMCLDDPPAVTLGAVGLGSSNDFHKPYSSGSFIDGVPVRVDCASARRMDVIRIVSGGDERQGATRHAIMNASLGITAEANAAFNRGRGLVRAARALSVDAAIVTSVLSTLATYRDVRCRVALDGTDLGEFSVSNLGVIKNPHFAGSFCYDTRVAPDDGKLGVTMCERLTPFQALATLAALRKRRFEGRPKTRSWTGERVSVEADRTFALETDGEVSTARSAEFSVVARAVRCCR